MSFETMMKRYISIAVALIMCISLCGCIRKADVSGGDSLGDTSHIADTSTPFAEDTDNTVDTESDVAEKENTVSIIMVGDILLHEAVTQSGLGDDGVYCFDSLFANVSDEIKSADIALVNQEVILGGVELGLSGYPAFNGPYEVGDAIANAGFDIVLHATNHALDKGSRGIENCCAYWESNHPEIDYIGISRSSAESNNIAIKEVNGIKIAFINYTYGTNGIPLPADNQNAVSLLDGDTVRSDVAYAKNNSDFVVVCPHWGTEYIHTPDSNQNYYTELFFQCGVDLVIGTHPHVTEPVEMIESGDRKMLVYYSIGNFVNSTAQTGAGIADRMVGAMADVTLTVQDGKVTVSDYGVIPIVTHLASGYGNITTYKLSDYTAELASQNLIVSSDPAFSLQYCQALTEDIFGELAH